MLPLPSRGEAWLTEFDPTGGREQRGTRHIALARADSGLDHDSFVICEQVRCVARERLTRRIGRAPDGALA